MGATTPALAMKNCKTPESVVKQQKIACKTIQIMGATTPALAMKNCKNAGERSRTTKDSVKNN